MESITDGFEAFDSRCGFEYLNRVAEQIIGKPRAELIGKLIWDAHPEMRGTAVDDKLREVLERRVAVHFEYFSKISKQWLEFHVHPGGSGDFTIYFRDINERKISELRLRET